MRRLRGGTIPIDRLLKDKRTPEEIELLNKAFNHALNLLGVADRNDPLCDMVARKVIEVGRTGISASRERSWRWPWSGLAYGKAASVGGLFIPNVTRCRETDLAKSMR